MKFLLHAVDLELVIGIVGAMLWGFGAFRDESFVNGCVAGLGVALVCAILNIHWLVGVAVGLLALLVSTQLE